MDRTRVLLADDDPVYLAVGVESLTAEDYEVVAVEDGEAALDAVEHQNFDLIILDVEMPKMTGHSVLKEIRASTNETLTSTPVMMVTGLNDDDAIRECYESGATSYIAKPVSWLNMTNQITFILRAEENAKAVRRSRDDALRRSRTKDLVFMTLRHELRSPLHIIKGFSSLLGDSLGNQLEDQGKHALSMIDDGVNAINDKMNRLFLFADILSGGFSLMPDFTTIQQVIQRAVKSVAALADSRGIIIAVTTTENASTEIKVDGEKLTIALVELLNNAVKHSPDGSTVHLRSENTGVEGLISFVVEDEGNGIGHGDVDQLFGAFVQGDHGVSRASVGIGLGLTVARAIARCHGGDVTIMNRDLFGTQATLSVSDELAKVETAA